jgi:hypothetical protein
MAVSGDYKLVIVETFRVSDTSGRHGEIHVRPAVGQPFPQSLFVECSRRMVTDYPVGTLFKIQAKLVEKDTGNKFLYSYFGWTFEVITAPPQGSCSE